MTISLNKRNSHIEIIKTAIDSEGATTIIESTTFPLTDLSFTIKQASIFKSQYIVDSVDPEKTNLTLFMEI